MPSVDVQSHDSTVADSSYTQTCRSELFDLGGRTVAGAGALPGVLRGDVSSSGGGEMAQPLSRQPHGVSAASRWAAAAQTAIVTHPGDFEAQRLLDVRYNACTKESNMSDGTHTEH